MTRLSMSQPCSPRQWSKSAVMELHKDKIFWGIKRVEGPSPSTECICNKMYARRSHVLPTFVSPITHPWAPQSQSSRQREIGGPARPGGRPPSHQFKPSMLNQNNTVPLDWNMVEVTNHGKEHLDLKRDQRKAGLVAPPMIRKAR